MITLIFSLSTPLLLPAQTFYFGADQSYVNELEDCGATYFENGEAKDVYDIFADHGCNLVRLRLWHTPSWYDNLNDGQRYSDLADVQKSIARAKAQNMDVLLDFHLSDTWADPSNQLVPAAWLDVVDDLPILQDSLYNYIFNTLSTLHQENVLPELVQIGNETNKGILQSPTDNETWALDWPRNAALFNTAISAVRAVENNTGASIKIVLHVADPDNTAWLIQAFHDNGVTDFDIIGISYYWAWHQPTTIAQTGEAIEQLRDTYPDKEVLIVETGYIWTNESNDNANNIISAVHPDYSPASPTNQRDWLIDLAKVVIESGGLGVCYWEPSWVSSDCYTQWGQGSHQEHATFFDFDNHLLLPGGIEWMNYPYDLTTSTQPPAWKEQVKISYAPLEQQVQISLNDHSSTSKFRYAIVDSIGRQYLAGKLTDASTSVSLKNYPSGLYVVLLKGQSGLTIAQKIVHYVP
ncbi:MAG: glycosyl hydrolase 53 family protein [Bacteroidota bacterium]